MVRNEKIKKDLAAGGKDPLTDLTGGSVNLF